MMKRGNAVLASVASVTAWPWSIMIAGQARGSTLGKANSPISTKLPLQSGSTPG